MKWLCDYDTQRKQMIIRPFENSLQQEFHTVQITESILTLVKGLNSDWCVSVRCNIPTYTKEFNIVGPNSSWSKHLPLCIPSPGVDMELVQTSDLAKEVEERMSWVEREVNWIVNVGKSLAAAIE